MRSEEGLFGEGVALDLTLVGVLADLATVKISVPESAIIIQVKRRNGNEMQEILSCSGSDL